MSSSKKLAPRLGLLKRSDGHAIRTCVVRLKALKRGEGKDSMARFTSLYKRTYLLVLTSDSMSLVTSKDADGDEASDGVTKSRPVGAALAALLRGGSREVSDRGGEGGDDDLEDGQIFQLGIALSQVLSVAQVEGGRLCVAFQPNKPTKKSVTRHAKGILLAAFTSDSAATAEPSPRGGAGGAECHSFTIELRDDGEAAALKADIQDAMSRLEEALAWLDQRLPLNYQTTVMCVTVDEGAGQHQTVFPFPEFGQRLALPPAVGAALQPLEAAGAGGALAASPAGPQAAGTIKAWLSTALGPAVATITPGMLWEPAGEEELLRTVVAQVRSPAGQLAADSALHINTAAKDVRLQVLLRFASERIPASATLGPLPTAERQQQQPSQHGREDRLLAASAVLLAGLAAWVAHGDALGAPSWASALRRSPLVRVVLLCLIAVGAALLLLRRFKRPSAEASPDAQAPVRLSQWFLRLESCELIRSTKEQLVPQMQRSLTQTGNRSTSSSGLLSPGARLPECIRALVEAHPEVLDSNIAERFVVGLEDVSKAHTAMVAMVKWLKENDMVGLVDAPQPAFEIIKKHYIHGNVCRSASKDCVVELECLGRWPAAYRAIQAEGVTDEQLLRHLLFTYLYCFMRIDPRPLPAGKTVKIVDLAGLGMSDVGSPGFKFISKAGALLACNFPQRLHKAFLVNAPSWWAIAWKLISPMLPSKVRQQMLLFSKNDRAGMRAALLEWVPEDQLPVAYGGTCTTPLAEGALEVEMLAYVRGLAASSKAEAA